MSRITIVNLMNCKFFFALLPTIFNKIKPNLDFPFICCCHTSMLIKKKNVESQDTCISFDFTRNRKIIKNR